MPQVDATTITPAVLTAAQACVYLSCCKATLYGFVRDGLLKRVRLGKANGKGVRFRRQDLDRLIDFKRE